MCKEHVSVTEGYKLPTALGSRSMRDDEAVLLTDSEQSLIRMPVR
jgi:hypothetical protein